METWHKVDDAADYVLLSSNEYNELGQLVTKKLHSGDNGSTFKQNEDYRYNIRGWLTRINDATLTPDNANDPADLFGMNLLYNEQDNALGNEQQFNGNISAIKWSHNLGLGSGATQNAYTYQYDALNRLNAATFQDNSGGTFTQTSLFNEDNITYDLNGNIRSLYRTGDNDAIDVLTYNYGEGTNKHSNKLLSVTDAADITKGFKDGNTSGDDYDYDVNGNMTVDNNKDITGIQYNHLNLPYIVTKNTGEYIKYSYDATGTKLRQQVYDASNTLKKTTDYDGEFFYENDTLKFINHEEGRVVMAHPDGDTTPEYQYNLKDQLGNVRLTFTSKEETDEATATMEMSNATEEHSEFLNYDEVTKISSPLFDHTNEGTTFNSVRLMGGNTTEVYGLAKSLSVMPGDVLNLEVYAKYLDPDPNNWSTALTNAIAAIAGTANPNGTFVDGGATGNTDGPFPYPNVLVRENDNGTGPKAYLNYIIFDRNFTYLDGGFKRVSTNAREYGQGTDQAEGIPHERLFLDNILIKEPGYVYIYLSNENETPVEVFFDDFEVEHVKSPVVQMDDYYPFGLTFNNYQRENSTENKFRFQGQEHIDDLDLGWDSFKWRNHQPEIGRFFNVDPLAEKYYYNSPYAFSENKVVAHVELEGLEAYPIGQNSNPLYYIAEGFRQYFDAVLSAVSVEVKAYTKVSGTNIGLSTGSFSVSTTTETETKAYVNVSFSGVMDNNGTNTPAPGKIIDSGVKTTISQKTEANAKLMTDGVPINITARNTLNSTDQTITNTAEVSVGVNEGNVQGKVYVSNSTTTQTDGNSDNKTSVGLKIETPIYNLGKQKVSVGIQGEIVH